MNEWQRARICWIPATMGGRKQPPTGPRYSTVARFNDEDDQNEWSVIIEFEQQPDDRGCLEAQIRFLAPEAPFYLFQPGKQFHLLEGARVVATVEIISRTKLQPGVNGASYQAVAVVSSD